MLSTGITYITLCYGHFLGKFSRTLKKKFSVEDFSNERARNLVLRDLHSETNGSRFESGCKLCAEVSSLQ